MTARVHQGNGYYPSALEIEAGADGDVRLRVKGLLSHRTPRGNGQLWERVLESGLDISSPTP